MVMEKPKAEVVLFDQDDIIVTSTPSGCSGDGTVLCQTGDDCLTDL